MGSMLRRPARNAVATGAVVVTVAPLPGRQAAPPKIRPAGQATGDGGIMSIEQHKAIARRWSEELWGRGNLAVADEIIAPDYVRHDAGDPFPARGPEDI